MFCATSTDAAKGRTQRRPRVGGVRRCWRRLLWISLMGVTAAAGQTITNTSGGTLAAVIALGSLTPGTGSALATGTTQFRLRDNNTNGYRVDASATFTPGAAGTVNGGSTIAASDIGIGITSVAATANVIKPRTDTILAGFNYDPTTVTAVDGLTPYAGAAGGRATLADLAASQKILSGTRIGNNANYLTVTMKFGLLPQYFSPSSFSAVITLTISNGP